MATEYEGKILDIDPKRVAETIVGLGGRRTGEFLLRRLVYDVVPGDAPVWLRLRDNGRECTLTVKRIAHDGIDGTDEVETTLGDFETTDRLLNQLGYKARSYQENRRVSFVLGGTRLEIDTWPMIPAYLEIEGDSRDDVIEVATMLGYDESQLTGENSVKVYARYGIDLLAIPDLRFPG